MNPVLRIALYVVLALSALVFAQRFAANYHEKEAAMARRFDRVESTNSPTEAAAVKPAVVAAHSHMGLYGACALLSLITIGLMVGHDVSHYLADRAHKALFNEELEGVANPEYEQAEQVWADGDHLEAVRLMREYLLKNPREQHVALRIAEIYEKDLKNPLAAALEYEEVLTKKLPPDNWGWAAIHLCNLYYHLNKPEKAVALLRRIDNDYPETAAAEKARKRLALYEAGETGEIEQNETGEGTVAG